MVDIMNKSATSVICMNTKGEGSTSNKKNKK